MTSALFVDSDGFDLVEVVEGLEFGIAAEEDPAADEVRQELGGLVGHVPGGRNSEDVVEFLCRS